MWIKQNCSFRIGDHAGPHRQPLSAMSLGGGAYFQERNEKEGVPYDAPAMPVMKEVFGPSKADQEKAAEQVRRRAPAPGGWPAGPGLCSPSVPAPHPPARPDDASLPDPAQRRSSWRARPPVEAADPSVRFRVANRSFSPRLPARRRRRPRSLCRPCRRCR